MYNYVIEQLQFVFIYKYFIIISYNTENKISVLCCIYKCILKYIH